MINLNWSTTSHGGYGTSPYLSGLIRTLLLALFIAFCPLSELHAQSPFSCTSFSSQDAAAQSSYVSYSPYASSTPYTPHTSYTPNTSNTSYSSHTSNTSNTPYTSHTSYTPNTPYSPNTSYSSHTPMFSPVGASDAPSIANTTGNPPYTTPPFGITNIQREGFPTPSNPGQQGKGSPVGEAWLLLFFAAAYALYAAYPLRKKKTKERL